MIGVKGFGIAAAGGRIVAPKTTLNRINTNSYSITNYDDRLTYTVTSSTSGASVSGSTITLPTLSFPAAGQSCSNRQSTCTAFAPIIQTFTVQGSTPKGAAVSSPQTVIERRTPSYSWVVVGSGRDVIRIDPVGCSSADEGPPWVWILQPYICGSTPVFGPFYSLYGWVKQAPPSGFIETGQEWYRIV
jgi:hypothetical protein